MCAKFITNSSGGYGVLTPQNCHFPQACWIMFTTYVSITVLQCDATICTTLQHTNQQESQHLLVDYVVT